MRCKTRRWRVFKYLAYLFCDRYLWSMQWVAGCHGGRATRETIWLEIITYRTNAASSRPNSVNKYFIIWPSLFSPFSSFFSFSSASSRLCGKTRLPQWSRELLVTWNLWLRSKAKMTKKYFETKAWLPLWEGKCTTSLNTIITGL